MDNYKESRVLTRRLPFDHEPEKDWVVLTVTENPDKEPSKRVLIKLEFPKSEKVISVYEKDWNTIVRHLSEMLGSSDDQFEEYRTDVIKGLQEEEPSND